MPVVAHCLVHLHVGHALSWRIVCFMALSRYGHGMTFLHTIFDQLSMETHRVHPRYFDQGYIDLNLQGPLTLSGLMP